MKKYLAWKKLELDSPALACPAPVLARAPPGATDWPALASPPPTLNPSGYEAYRPPQTGFGLTGPSAFSVVPPASVPGLTANFLPNIPLNLNLLCFPNILDKLGGQNILRSHMSTTQYKPIPNNDRVDLSRFRVKDPIEWNMDDVIAYIVDVARRNALDIEELNLHNFQGITANHFMTYPESFFAEKDAKFGPMLLKDFKARFINSTEDNLIDEAMKKYKDSEDESNGPSTSYEMTLPQLPHPPPQLQQPSPIAQGQSHRIAHSPFNINSLNTLNQSINNALNPSLNNLNNLTMQQSLHNQLSHQLSNSLSSSLASTLAAGLSSGLSPMNLGLIQNGLSPSSPMISSHIQQKISPLPNEMLKYASGSMGNPGSVSSDYDACDERLHSVESKIKKNKDGKPRKRSQHTKGNKLWEFIRDALKDPTTCPSVVRWEDPVEGVFRIVESEKLARLWGERKNNTKMTYEKLSRAMRTYYEKQILVPVPKTGLYPKKLVYKFGPGANGWNTTIKQEL